VLIGTQSIGDGLTHVKKKIILSKSKRKVVTVRRKILTGNLEIIKVVKEKNKN